MRFINNLHFEFLIMYLFYNCTRQCSFIDINVLLRITHSSKRCKELYLIRESRYIVTNLANENQQHHSIDVNEGTRTNTIIQKQTYPITSQFVIVPFHKDKIKYILLTQISKIYYACLVFFQFYLLNRDVQLQSEAQNQQESTAINPSSRLSTGCRSIELSVKLYYHWWSGLQLEMN